MSRQRLLSSVFSVLLLSLSACGSSSSPTGAEEGPRFGTINQEQLQRMMEVAPEGDGPFYMVNLIKFREKADYLDGRETDLTGREADALYAPFEFLAAIGARIMFVGGVEANLITYDGTQWDQVAVVLYPSRALFFQMNADPEFQARAVHKEAGVEKTIVMVSHLQESLSPPPPDEVPNPGTPEDPEVAIVHLLKYNEAADYGPDSNEPERTGREAMLLYQQAATPVALEQGVDPVAWFEIEGVLIGDEREWDEFRINLFPSHAAFDAVVADPTRQAGQVHRQAAIKDTYSTSNEVIINGFVEG